MKFHVLGRTGVTRGKVKMADPGRTKKVEKNITTFTIAPGSRKSDQTTLPQEPTTILNRGRNEPHGFL